MNNTLTPAQEAYLALCAEPVDSAEALAAWSERADAAWCALLSGEVRALRHRHRARTWARHLAASKGAPPPRTIDRAGDVALAPWVYPWLRREHGWAPGDPLPPCAQGPDRGARAALLHAEPRLGGALLWALEVVGPWGYHALIDVRGARRRQEAWWWARSAASG